MIFVLFDISVSVCIMLYQVLVLIISVVGSSASDSSTHKTLPTPDTWTDVDSDSTLSVPTTDCRILDPKTVQLSNPRHV